MKFEQKFVPEPLRAEDAMVASWRQIRKIETGNEDNDDVLNVIKKL